MLRALARPLEASRVGGRPSRGLSHYFQSVQWVYMDFGDTLDLNVVVYKPQSILHSFSSHYIYFVSVLHVSITFCSAAIVFVGPSTSQSKDPTTADTNQTSDIVRSLVPVN